MFALSGNMNYTFLRCSKFDWQGIAPAWITCGQDEAVKMQRVPSIPQKRKQRHSRNTQKPPKKQKNQETLNPETESARCKAQMWQ